MKRALSGAIATILARSPIAAIPFTYMHWATGLALPDVLPQLEADSLYYLVQMNEVLSGRWLLGNPYFMEYGELRSPAILLPIWIASLPGALGLSINSIFAVNICVYTILTGLFFYILLFRATKGNAFLSITLSIVGVAYVHNLIVRPAIMQTVYPAFLLFLIAFLLYLEKPDNVWRAVGVAITAALGFYMYLYVWMTAFTMIGLVLLWSLLRRNGPLIRSQIIVWPLTGALCMSQIVLMMRDRSDPMFVELAYRTGLISTHLIHPLTVFNLKYVILTVAALILLYWKRTMPKSAVLVLITSIALVIAATSNLVTGAMLDLSTHLWRLSLVIAPPAIACFLLIAWKERERKLWERLVAGCCAILLLATAAQHIVIRANAFPYLRNLDAGKVTNSKIQQYKPVLDFLNSLPAKRQVILTMGYIGAYVPLYTDHTLLFLGTGRFNPIPTAELQERFLVQYVDSIDPEFIRKNVRELAGIGPLREQEYTEVCRTLPFCSADTTAHPIEHIGGNTFVEDMMELHEKIDREYEERLAKFHVSLIVVDKESGQSPRIPESATRIYNDDRFSMFQLKGQ
ncbi:MAG: hypothetical protein PHU04_05735 [Candidatus Peribacteraceae bacterium]|nr:hypothetical protein [Candidatus Peribacteraceae bacterium]